MRQSERGWLMETVAVVFRGREKEDQTEQESVGCGTVGQRWEA